MTPAERLARGLDSGKSDEGVDGQMHEDAAAIIRRLAAALSEAEAAMPHNEFFFWRKRHAGALRDVREDV